MIEKCLFPVAGYGTRFLPATKSTPKEMLPIVNKPLLQYGVEEALDAGMLNCALVTGRGKRAIADHFDLNYELEAEIAGSSKEKYLEGIRDVIDRGVFTMVRQRAMKGLETSTQRAREAAREARDEALETWNENIRPGLEPLEAETRARAAAVGNELIDAVEAARSKLRDALDNDA